MSKELLRKYGGSGVCASQRASSDHQVNDENDGSVPVNINIVAAAPVLAASKRERPKDAAGNTLTAMERAKELLEKRTGKQQVQQVQQVQQILVWWPRGQVNLRQ